MRLVLAAGVACAVAGVAAGQNAMPGKEVGSGFSIKPVGNELRKVAPPVGSAPSGGLGSRPYDPSKPYEPLKQAGLDPDSVIAPLSAYPAMPSGAEPDLIDKMYAKIGATFGLFPKPNVTPPPNPTPGIFRRNRERAKERAMFRRD